MISSRDADILKKLAERKRTHCDDPANIERRDAWLALDAGGKCRPMILAEVMGLHGTESPLPTLQCEGKLAQQVEHQLITNLYEFETLKDDHVLEPTLQTAWKIGCSNYGVEVLKERGKNATGTGSLHWDAPIKDLAIEFDKLKPRTFSVDRDSTRAEQAALRDALGGILDVEIRGMLWWTTGLTIDAIDLIGLEPLMLNMYDEPDALHALMAFLRDDHLNFFQWLEKEDLLTLNNRNDYIGSGSMGYTRDLPAADFDGTVRTQDLWVLSESQETVGVSPELFEEFVFPYQLDITKRFGKTYYGCCEPLDKRMHIIRQMKNLARVSVSPWADQEKCAELLGRDMVFSRKPSPTTVSTGTFDESALRADLRRTLDIAKDNRLEIIMKDVHTLNGEPDRLARWVQIARSIA